MSEKSSCEIMGPLGFFVQLTLGVLAFLVLVFKREKEKPKRSLKIWSLDVSKQGISALLAHFLNVMLSIIMSEKGSDDACVWFFITLMMDSTIGVLVSYGILQLIEHQFTQRNMHNYKTGNYIVMVQLQSEELEIQQSLKLNQEKDFKNIEMIDKLKATQKEQQKKVQDIEAIQSGLGSFIKIDYFIWMIQLIIWNICVLLSKSVMYGLQQLMTNQLEELGNWIFKGINQYPELKIIIVLALVPLTMNAFCFWIQDNFLKKQEITKIEAQYGIAKFLYDQADNFDKPYSTSPQDNQNLTDQNNEV